MMIYLNNDASDYITSDNFVTCGNEERDSLSKEYHLPEAEELYNFINGLEFWNDVPAEAYDQLAELCKVQPLQADEDPEGFMERCFKSINK